MSNIIVLEEYKKKQEDYISKFRNNVLDNLVNEIDYMNFTHNIDGYILITFEGDASMACCDLDPDLHYDALEQINMHLDSIIQ